MSAPGVRECGGWVRSAEDAVLVARNAVPIERAQRIVAELIAQGREASWAPDVHRSLAWVYPGEAAS